jgi:hypothetical protein
MGGIITFFVRRGAVGETVNASHRRVGLVLALALLAAAAVPAIHSANASTSSPTSASVVSPPPVLKRALLAGGYRMYSAVRNPIGRLSFISIRVPSPGIGLARRAVGRRSIADARYYAAYFGKEPNRTYYGVLFARDAGVSSATITRVRVIGTYALFDLRLVR